MKMEPLFKNKLTFLPSPKPGCRVLIVDVANLAHRSLYAHRELTTKTGKPSGHVHGSIQSLISVVKRLFKNGKVCMVFAYEGNDSKERRQAICAEYKSNREPGRFDPKDEVKNILQNLPGTHIQRDGYEADDVIAYAAEMLATAAIPTVILSSDQDMWPLLELGHQTQVYVPTKPYQGYITGTDVTAKYGIRDCRKVLLYKAVFGDPSDALKGVPRLRKAHVLPLINKGSVQDPKSLFRKATQAYKAGALPENTYQKLVAGKQGVFQRWAIVQPIPLDARWQDFTLTKPSVGVKDELLRQLAKFGCNVAAREVEIFFDPS